LPSSKRKNKENCVKIEGEVASTYKYKVCKQGSSWRLSLPMSLVKLFKLMNKEVEVKYIHGEKWAESYLLIELVQEEEVKR